MTDMGRTAPSATDSTTVRPVAGTSTIAEPTGWVGWVFFAGMMMILLGAIQIIEGIVALVNHNYYKVGPNDLVIRVGFGPWGWVHLALGVVVVLAGFGVMTGRTWARVVGIILAAVSAIVNIGFIDASPIWAVIVIALDVIVIYALAVHGREVRV
jgi:hypothetical protein